MEKFELIKTIEARKLNKKTGIPLAGPLITIPYGTIIENPTVDRDIIKFAHLNELYQCAEETFREATTSVGAAVAPAPKQAERPAAVPQPALRWESVDTDMGRLYRAKAPGGWLVSTKGLGALTFCPDPQHAWDLTALP